jgi:hypothetical protein
MESVLIAAPREYGAEFKSRLQVIGPVEMAAGDGFVLDDKTSRVYVIRNNAAPEELEPERLERITAVMENPFFYSVEFSDIAFCRRVLEVIADDPGLIVDNDHGVILSGSEFVRLLRSQQGWDWRTDAL